MAKHKQKDTGRKMWRKKGWSLYAVFGVIVLLSVICAVFWIRSRPKLLAAVTIEAGSAIPSAQVFLLEDMEIEISYESDVSGIDTRNPGEYPVILWVGGDTYHANIVVADTIAPQGTTRDLTVYQEDMPTAEEFIVDIQDVTDVTVSFKEEPDRNCAGNQNVTLVLTDTSGNTTEVGAILTIVVDRTAPQIEGVRDVEVYQGETVAYRTGISVWDDRDESPALVVDSSKVDLSLPGVYEVIYIATDATGNKTEIIAKVTVLEKKESYVELDLIYEKADRILTENMEESMTDEERVKAVYHYMRKNYGYLNYSDKSDWRQAAYKMMETHSGDCFSYFALFKLFMERLEIPNIDVVKVKNYAGDSNHFWSLVSIDGGETYYHVDVTPRKGDSTQFLLVTDEFLDNYSAKHYNCFNRDKSLYPGTP